MMRLIVTALLVGSALLAGCYAPGAPARCTVACSATPSQECPDGLTCFSDKFCHQSTDEPQCSGPLPGIDAPDPIVDAAAGCLASSTCDEPTLVCNTAPASAAFGDCIPDYARLREDCAAASSIGSGRQTGASTIWRAQLLRIQDCGPGLFGYQLTIDYFDPTGNGPTSASTGTVMRADFGDAPLNLTGSGFAFVAADGTSGTMLNAPCVSSNPLPASIAVRLVDDAGNLSNTACLNP
ncbi:MAG: hypothetical protein H6Q90_2780 [Deltaproteobacteria bacterium]|nr:hypothetical protein [Deltaproteobacteria bacterium]